MTSNEKKGYQYYFKKDENNDARESLSRLPGDSKTMPYIRYQKYEKSRFTNPDSASASKDPRGEKVNASFGIEKRNSLYSSGYTPMKIQLHRQPSIDQKTETPQNKFINPSSSTYGYRYPLKIGLNSDRIMESKVQDKSVTSKIQQNLCQSQTDTKPNESTKNIQQFEMSPKSKQFHEFFNQTLGNPSLSLDNPKRNGKQIQNKNSSNNSQNEIKFLDEIQKFKINLQASQIDETTIYTNSRTLLPVEINETVVQTNNCKMNGSCLDCEKIRKDLEKSQNQTVELEKKRQANIDQILRQQKTIKEMQENELRLKSELTGSKGQLNELFLKVEDLEKQKDQAKTLYTTLQAEFTSKLQSELSKIRQNHTHVVESLQQKISTYVSTINKQNKKIAQMQENYRQAHKEMCLQHEKENQKMKQMHGEEMNRIKEKLKQENSTIGKYYLDREKKLVEKQQKQLEEMRENEVKSLAILKEKNETVIRQLIRKHETEILRLGTEIQSLTQNLTQIPTLSETIQKQQSQILQQKTAKYSLEKQLNGYKMYVEQLKKESGWLKDSISQLEKKVGEKTKEVTMLNEIRDKLEKKVAQNDEITNRLNAQLDKDRTKTNEMEKEFVLFKFMNQAFKITIDRQEYESIENKAKAIIQSNGSVQLITQKFLGQEEIDSPTQLAQESSISPSTSSHPKPHKKNVKNKEKQTQINQIKELNLKLSQLSTKYEQKVKELQLKDEVLQMNQKTINLLEENVLNKKKFNEETQSEYQKKVTELQSSVAQKKNLIAELNLKLISFGQQLQEKNDLVLENDEVIEKLEKSLKELMYEKENEKECIEECQSKFSSPQRQRSVKSLESVQSSSSKSPAQDEVRLISPSISDRSEQEQQKSSSKELNQSKSSGSVKMSPRSVSVSALLQQIQVKEEQISELSQQLEDSVEIIKVLKEELEERERQFAIFQDEATKKSPNKVNNQGLDLSQNLFEQTKKQEIFKQYFTKIEEYYNEVLEIFGLEQVSSQIMNLENVSPIRSPRQSQTSQDYVDNHQNSSEKKQNLVGFEHEDIINGSFSASKSQNFPNTPQKQSTHSKDPFQQALCYLSSNQQEVLRIINQWIRKLQRQSMSIHQGKEKIHGLQRQLKQLKEYNSVLSMEKIQIYEKYEAFIAKLDQENTHLEEKGVEMGQKITELETYIKELEDLIQDTNRECMKNGIYSLQLVKEHSVGDLKPIYFNTYELSLKERQKIHKQPQLLMSKEKSATHHHSLEYLSRLLIQQVTDGGKQNQVRVAKSYWEDFYQRHNNYSSIKEQKDLTIEDSEQPEKQVKKRCKTLQVLPKKQSNEPIETENQQISQVQEQLEMKIQIENQAQDTLKEEVQIQIL